MEVAKREFPCEPTGWLAIRERDTPQMRGLIPHMRPPYQFICVLLEQLLFLGLDSLSPQPLAGSPLAQLIEAEFLKAEL